MKRLIIITSLALGLWASAAPLKLGHMLGDHMVLQQQTQVAIDGTATPRSTIEISPSWTDVTYTAVTDDSGRWQATIDTPEGGYTAYQIDVREKGSDQAVRVDDVLIGEVWLAAGQSNMQMPLKGFDGCNVLGGYEEIAASRDWAGKIRCYNVPMEQSWEPLSSVEASWQVPAPATAQDFSATAWYFAQRLNQGLQVPVGIVNIAFGGSKVESWLPREILEGYTDVSLDKATVDAMTHYLRPMLMYNAMFCPILPYKYAGIIWYQGCSNVSTWTTYADRLATMVEHWRQRLGQGDIPFYQVEIAPYQYDGPGEEGRSPYLREQQHLAATMIPNCDIISINDLVVPYERYNIHPGNKSAVGRRLADLALNRHYGDKTFLAGSPRYRSHRIADGKVWVSIDSPNHGICRNYDIQGFEVAGEDGVFYPADQADFQWQTNEVVLSSQAVPEPVAVRYCFRDFQPGTLYGGNYLPLIPFRTDNWLPED